MTDTTTLYRPVGLAERNLIAESGYSGFPPRLPHQPIFYPVTNEVYATKIARDWNTKEETGVGFVTRFKVRSAYLSSYERKIVGGREHEEYWIPAEEVGAFNAAIVGRIEIISEFRLAGATARDDASSKVSP